MPPNVPQCLPQPSLLTNRMGLEVTKKEVERLREQGQKEKEIADRMRQHVDEENQVHPLLLCPYLYP